MKLSKEFVTKCNKLAEKFEGLDKGDFEVELTKISKECPSEYENILMYLWVGMNIEVAK